MRLSCPWRAAACDEPSCLLAGAAYLETRANRLSGDNAG